MAELVNVKGFAELKIALDQFSKGVSRNVLRGAVNAGASVIRNQARLNAPVMYKALPNHQPPGTLKRAIVNHFVKELSNLTQIVINVAVRMGKSRRGQGKKQTLSQDAYYAGWIEYGHFFVGHKPKGTTWKKHRETEKAGGKFIPAQPFMRPAYEAKKMNAVDAMRTYLEKRIPAEVEKARKK